MKRIVCFGGGDPAIKECLQSGNGQERTAIIAGDYYPEDYPDGDPKRVWGPHYQSFEKWIREISPDCHVVSRETDSHDAMEAVRRSKSIAIEGGFPDRYLNWMVNKNIFDLIRDMFLNGDDLQELWTLSAGAISLCEEARYFIEDDGDPARKLDITPHDKEHLTKSEQEGKTILLERRTGLGIIPNTIIKPHSTECAERWFARAGFFRGYRGAFVCLGEDGAMEIFYERTNGGAYRPVAVNFTGYHRIKRGGTDINKETYLKVLTSGSGRN